MSYNTDLQTNNTNLQSVLTSVQNLSSSDDFSTTETWELTMEDGSVEEVQVENIKVCEIGYNLDDGITSSNTSTFIRQGDVYETVLSSGDSGNYKNYDEVMTIVSKDGLGSWDYFEPDTTCPWLVYISVPLAAGYNSLEIFATLSGIGSNDEEGI